MRTKGAWEGQRMHLCTSRCFFVQTRVLTHAKGKLLACCQQHSSEIPASSLHALNAQHYDYPEHYASCFAGPLLQAAAQLIRHFPVFRDIVVSVARKTDAQMWPALFAAVGSPGALLEALLDVGALQSAACCLLIVDRIQGAQEAHGLALRLIQVSKSSASTFKNRALLNAFRGSQAHLTQTPD